MRNSEVVDANYYEYRGPVALCKGASSEQKALEQQQSSFFSTLQDSYNKQFTAQSNILQSLRTAWTPILQAGISQFGYTPTQEAAIRTSTSDANAAAARTAKQATANSLDAVGGGNMFLPSGSKDKINRNINTELAAKEASDQNAITTRGYDLGRS